MNATEQDIIAFEEELERFAYSLPHAAHGIWPAEIDHMSVEARTEYGVQHTWSYEQVRRIARHFLVLGNDWPVLERRTTMKRPRYRRLRKVGNRWHGKDGKSVYIVRFIRNGHVSLRWPIKLS